MAKRGGIRRWAFLAACPSLLLAGGVVGCGARTGLDAPEVVDLQRDRPAVVYVLERSNIVLLPGGDQAILFQRQNDFVRGTVPLFEPLADLGMVRLPDPAIQREYNPCAALTTLTRPIAPGQGPAIIQYTATVDFPNGAAPVGLTLTTAGTALRAAGDAHTPRWIVLVYTGDDVCLMQRPAEVAAQLARDGIRTLVAGMYLSTAGPDNFSAQLEGIALAGGAPATVGRYHFYPSDRIGDLQDAIQQSIVRPFYCHGRLPPQATHLRVLQADTRVLVRDPAHVNGWDYRATAPDEVELFGATCDQTVEARATLRAVLAPP